MNIENKTILVTGANRGIGKALVEEALKRGARRVYAGMRTVVPSSNPRLVALKLDVTDQASVDAAAAKIPELDLLINNAGVAPYDDLSSLAVIEQALSVNLFGIARVTLAFLPALKRSRGAILNNLSMVALAPFPVIPAYSASKAAALNLTQSYRALLASHGVSVHGVILGPIDTDMNRGIDIPKASPESTAQEIFEGLSRKEEEIFPDPASKQAAAGWIAGVAKGIERQFAAMAAQPQLQS